MCVFLWVCFFWRAPFDRTEGPYVCLPQGTDLSPLSEFREVPTLLQFVFFRLVSHSDVLRDVTLFFPSMTFQWASLDFPYAPPPTIQDPKSFFDSFVFVFSSVWLVLVSVL